MRNITLCKSCAWSNPADATVCERCGEALAPQPSAPAHQAPTGWGAPQAPKPPQPEWGAPPQPYGAVPYPPPPGSGSLNATPSGAPYHASGPGYQYPPPPAKSGMGKGAIAAIVIGALLVAGVPVVGVFAAIAIPSLLAARRASNESAAVGSLRQIAVAEAAFYIENGRYATMSELQTEGLLDSAWAEGGVRDGYRFSIVEVGTETFEFKAEPLSASNGTRAFNITEEMIVRYREGVTAPDGDEGEPLGGAPPVRPPRR